MHKYLVAWIDADGEDRFDVWDTLDVAEQMAEKFSKTHDCRTWIAVVKRVIYPAWFEPEESEAYKGIAVEYSRKDLEIARELNK